jgi:NAD(P)H-hydrate epimerase
LKRRGRNALKLVNAKEMRAIDRSTIRDFGVKGLVLMENAGKGVARAALKELEGAALKRVAIVAGKGNNGGDGFVCARHLKNAGYEVRVFSTVSIKELKGDALKNALAWELMGGVTRILRRPSDIKKHSVFFAHSALIIDALLGTGLTSNVRGAIKAVIDYINSLSIRVLSIDMPSGISADTGAVMGTAVSADITVTMALAKLGLYQYPGREYAGRVEVIDIGVPDALLVGNDLRCNLIDDDLVRSILRPRSADTNKGSYGHLLVIAGSPGKSGAAYLAATAAMRAGAGLVTIALPEGLNPLMEIKTTEVMTAPLVETGAGTLSVDSLPALKRLIRGKSALVIGPGLGDSKGVGDLVRALLTSKDIRLPPILMDADGLNVLKNDISILKKVKAQLVLTPHPGEMARLFNITSAKVQADRVGSAIKLTSSTGAVVLLKGASTVISAPNGEMFINPTGSPALASAGTGDVLSGMIGAFMANGYAPMKSAVAGAYLHGVSAEKLVNEAGGFWNGHGGPVGMLASDLFPVIPRVINCFTDVTPCGC